MENASPLPLDPPLSPFEARVLGCLIEKERATPEYYPLTLNSLVAACNQKNNRDPILNLGAGEVEVALESLRNRKLASVFAGAEARVAKHKHTFDVVFPIEPVAVALIAELLLRGPQTTASLRGNSERLCAMPELAEIEAILIDLAARPSGGLVQKLARLPGQKEARWAQRLTGDASAAVSNESAPMTVSLTLPPEAEKRFAALETEVAQLRAELAKLRSALGES
ncbi:MAG: YceH family protein [Nibricoccus sp.]